MECCWGESRIATRVDYKEGDRMVLYEMEDNAQRNGRIPLLHESRRKELEKRCILPGNFRDPGGSLLTDPSIGRNPEAPRAYLRGTRPVCNNVCTEHEIRLPRVKVKSGDRKEKAKWGK